ncbi:hypothetical protein [Arachidicoccus soli]|uniref:Transposase DDE domain-containing protein n=1 Tax=Arachidicoccus soli TaxID=2341117 RepID=A0A386HU68_9BACT|nr:hypothetical protein [Arachidicoccus soli]AYD49051.1 hypothetical protein D6B99_16370 [Arachidicoccus soli]
MELKISKRKNSKKADGHGFLKTTMRKRIETSIREIIELTFQSILAVTREGFLLKILLFVMAYH